MIIILAGILLITLLGGFLSALSCREGADTIIMWVTGAMIVVISLSGFAWVIRQPTAIDVYRGKTELKITYEGKTPVDTIVIYKKGGE